MCRPYVAEFGISFRATAGSPKGSKQPSAKPGDFELGERRSAGRKDLPVWTNIQMLQRTDLHAAAAAGARAL